MSISRVVIAEQLHVIWSSDAWFGEYSAGSINERSQFPPLYQHTDIFKKENLHVMWMGNGGKSREIVRAKLQICVPTPAND